MNSNKKWVNHYGYWFMVCAYVCLRKKRKIYLSKNDARNDDNRFPRSDWLFLIKEFTKILQENEQPTQNILEISSSNKDLQETSFCFTNFLSDSLRNHLYCTFSSTWMERWCCWLRLNDFKDHHFSTSD